LRLTTLNYTGLVSRHSKATLLKVDRPLQLLLRKVVISVSVFVFPTSSMFLEAIQESLDCSNNDEEALFAICLLCAAICNDGE